MDIVAIVQAISSKRLRITAHAHKEAAEDQLKFKEIYQSVEDGQMIEDYPGDKPYPSCLIFGTTMNGKPIHSVWAYNVETQYAVLITVYHPDPERWIDFRERRK